MSDGISPSSRTSGSNLGETPGSGSGAGYDGEADVIRAFSRGLAPDPALTVSEWADRHRILSPRASSEAGRYRTDRTPYMRAIMDALSPSHPARLPPCRQIRVARSLTLREMQLASGIIGPRNGL